MLIAALFKIVKPGSKQNAPQWFTRYINCSISTKGYYSMSKRKERSGNKVSCEKPKYILTKEKNQSYKVI